MSSDIREAGNAAYKEGNYLVAHEQWSKAIRTDPRDARAYSNRSMLRLSVFGDVDGALEDAKAAVASDKAFARGYVRLEAAMGCAFGLGSLSDIREAFLEDEFVGMKAQDRLEKINALTERAKRGEAVDWKEELKDSDDDEELDAQERAEIKHQRTVNRGVESIIVAGWEAGLRNPVVDSAAVANGELLEGLRRKIKDRMARQDRKMVSASQWNERIGRRLDTKLTDAANAAPDAEVGEATAAPVVVAAEGGEAQLAEQLVPRQAGAADFFGTLPAALLGVVVSFWDWRLARAPRGPLCYWEAAGMPLLAVRSLRGSCRALFHAVPWRMLAPLASRNMTWETLAVTPEDVMGELTDLNVATVDERTFEDPGDDFSGGEMVETDNALLVGCLLDATVGNGLTASRVRTLHLSGNLHPAAACAVGALCPRLQSLEFNYVTVDPVSMVNLASGCPLLQFFNAGRYAADDDTLATLGEHCPHLRSFACDRSYGVSDTGVALLAKGCRGLVSVDLTRCSVRNHGVRQLLMQCRRLQELCLNECENVTSGAFECLVALMKNSDESKRARLCNLELRGTSCNKSAMQGIEQDCAPGLSIECEGNDEIGDWCSQNYGHTT
mmetsp:Transcript_77956/g.152520  ORF Transcript_77956/g.152520 Transcript_77956/m.152520 type:complete len:612 (+) Transcript_77956:34-1869(+)